MPSRRRAIPPVVRSIRLDGVSIEYEIRRSARRKKTVELSVRDGAARVAAPAAMSDADISAFVRSRSAWLLERLDDARDEPGAPRFVSGETMPRLGRDVRLVVEEDDRESEREPVFERMGARMATENGDGAGAPSVRLERGVFRVIAPRGLDDEERRAAVGAEFARWYRERAAELFPAAVDRWLPRMGIDTAPKVIVANQRSRWGSCSASGVLRLSWRLMMVEESLIEYVVVHELSHLSEMNHSPRFWAVVESHMPDAKLRRRQLREAGRALPRL